MNVPNLKFSKCSSCGVPLSSLEELLYPTSGGVSECRRCKTPLCNTCSITFPFCGNQLCQDCFQHVADIDDHSVCPICHTGSRDQELFSLVMEDDSAALRKNLERPDADPNVMERLCFVQAGSPPHIHKYRTPLYYAVLRGHKETVAVLLSMGALETAIASEYPDEDTDLFELASKSTPEEYRADILAILEESFRNRELTKQDLFFVARKGLTIFLCNLVNSENIDPLEENHLGHTILAYALFGHHLDICNFLLDKWAQEYIDSETDYLGLAILNRLGYPAIRGMINRGFKSPTTSPNTPPLWTHLHTAVSQGDIDLVKMLIQAGTDVDEICRNPTRQTPLMHAVEIGHLEAVQLLIGLGADLAVKDEKGWTALHVAANQKRGDIIKLLIESGADANTVDAEGGTPLHALANLPLHDYEAQRENQGIMDLVNNAAISVFDLFTSLVSDGKLKAASEVIQLLVHAGVKLNQENHNGHTAVNLALFKSENIIVGLALSRVGAKVGGMSIQEVKKFSKLMLHGRWKFG